MMTFCLLYCILSIWISSPDVNRTLFTAFGLESSIQLVKGMNYDENAKTVNCAKPSKYTGGVIATL